MNISKRKTISTSKLFRLRTLVVLLVIFIILLYSGSGTILYWLGEYLVYDENPIHSDAVVVLNTGVEYYPRLVEAAELYKRGFADKIVINGNRKTEALRDLEARGFQACCPWYENRVRIFELLNVPREAVMAVSAEDAYDTVSEAKIVGEEILKKGYKRIILTTSKSHTRRAHFIWTKIYKNRLNVIPVSAKTDPYDSKGWWRQGRQIRWVLAEYGAWVYYLWKDIKEG